MINLLPTAQLLGLANPVFVGDMICKWSNPNTSVMLYKLTWPLNTRPSYHLHVEDIGSNSVPVSIGVNRGLDEIDKLIAKVVANAATPRDLLALILEKNPEIEGLVCDHSPQMLALSIKSFTTQAQTQTQAQPSAGALKAKRPWWRRWLSSLRRK